MGGNASPFIADVYLLWCEYCYMTKIFKADYTKAKLVSYNCRYLDDICTKNYRVLVTLLKTYPTTPCYWKVVPVVTNKPHFWIFISVLLIINL